MNSEKSYINVILPLALPQAELTYSVPLELRDKIKPGGRVTVSVGAKKLYSAIAVSEHENKPDFAVKDITGVIDEEPIVTDEQLKLWRWMADYYLCTVGEVMKAALPSGLKIESKTNNRIASHEKTTVSRTSKKKRTAANRPETRIIVELGPDPDDEKKIASVLDSLSKAPKQHRLLISFLDMRQAETNTLEVTKDELLEYSGISSAVYNVCENKGIFRSAVVETVKPEKDLPTLSPAQTAARIKIKNFFAENKPVLLHGVTSSGKTEIYIRLIAEQLAQGKQVLYMLPEIAPATQIVGRLVSVFGNKVKLYHSGLNNSERVEIYLDMLKRREAENGACVVLGVRSSLFLPFSKLGLVIVDEEHENTYKQDDPAPRYNARDTAAVMSSFYGARVLSGSATPSIESYYNAVTGKYGLVELTERYGNSVLPAIEIVDMTKAKKKKQTISHFSNILLGAIEEAIGRREQVILFQNRRGFSPFVRCRECGHVPQCVNCDVALTYHKYDNKLSCHYCGHTRTMLPLGVASRYVGQ